MCLICRLLELAVSFGVVGDVRVVRDSVVPQAAGGDAGRVAQDA
jgi:hypothetical protein